MRTEEEMMDLILSFAKNDTRIRVVGMEGSRTNANIMTVVMNFGGFLLMFSRDCYVKKSFLQ